jgi:uncharacterized repeat protein (TIGR03806 family)
VQIFAAASAPAKLSAWNYLLSDGQTLRLQEGVLPYSLNTPLFSDYSHKFRTLWVPAGSKITYVDQGPLQFPAGAIVAKTFFYPKAATSTPGAIGAAQTPQVEGGETVDLTQNRLVETRMMVREANGQWGALTYVWDEDQRDATLLRTGKTLNVELVPATGTRTAFVYEVPNDSQCIDCHATNAATRRFEAIGPQANNMNKAYAYKTGTANQLDYLVALQLLSSFTAPAPAMAVWNDSAAPLEARARAYLDVNCSSCHNSVGRSGNTGLWLGLAETDPLRLGVCKAPNGGQRNNLFTYDVTPGNADASFLYYRLGNYRLNSDPLRVAMPELGRHVFHAEGNALIQAWINGMTQTCP